MRFLLDTHVFLWLLGEPDHVADDVRTELGDRGNEVLVSAASAIEVATKVRLGKLEPARQLVSTWSTRVRDIDAVELAVSTEHALLAGSMTWDHRDPFDRLLTAQALVENVTLVSNDTAMRGLPGLRLAAW